MESGRKAESEKANQQIGDFLRSWLGTLPQPSYTFPSIQTFWDGHHCILRGCLELQLKIPEKRFSSKQFPHISASRRMPMITLLPSSVSRGIRTTLCYPNHPSLKHGFNAFHTWIEGPSSAQKLRCRSEHDHWLSKSPQRQSDKLTTLLSLSSLGTSRCLHASTAHHSSGPSVSAVQTLSLSPSQRQTIFALATPPGKAGVAVIRISGPAVQEVYTQMIRPISASVPKSGKLPKPRVMERCRIMDPESGDLLDDGLVVYFAGENMALSRTLQVWMTLKLS